MPPRRRSPLPVPIDVEAVRRKLADGRIVRVGISRSAQFPDGGTGRVRHVGDPATDGEEYIQVELSLNGTRDVLPFMPADLTPATRAKSATPGAGGQGQTAPAKSRQSSADRPSTSMGGGGSLQASSAQAGSGANPPVGLPTLPEPAATRRTGVAHEQRHDAERDAISAGAAPNNSHAAPPAGDAGSAAGSAPVLARSGAGPSSARSKGTRGVKKNPAVVITIATTDAEPPQWRIEARVGVRVVLRSGSVSPARVWELVRQLDDETLTRTVSGILDDQRRSAQARADALTAELAQVRAELDALPDGR